MKLATLNDGSRDGLLAVVSRDLTRAHFAVGIASTMQQLMDDWNFRAPQLEDLYAMLNGGKPRHAFAFDPRHCMAPLPRAHRWAFARETSSGGGSSTSTTIASDGLFGPCDVVPLSSSEAELHVDAGVAVITADVARGASDSQALEAVRLFMLVQHLSVRVPLGQDRGEPDSAASSARLEPLATSFSPVAVTADELGAAWRGGRIEQVLSRQQTAAGAAASGPGLVNAWSVGRLIAGLVRHQRLGSGSILSSFGAAQDGPSARPSRLQLDAMDDKGQSIFGAIDQSLIATPGQALPETASMLQPVQPTPSAPLTAWP